MENGISIPQEAENFLVELENNARTGILVAYDGSFTGLLGVADPLKREAAVVVEGLKKMGVKPIMVTGDNWRTAQAVAKEVSKSHYTFNPKLGEQILLCSSLDLDTSSRQTKDYVGVYLILGI